MIQRQRVFDVSRNRAHDKWQRYRLFLWGAVSHLHPERGITGPADPELLREFLAGKDMARQGYIAAPADANPDDHAADTKARAALFVSDQTR